MSNMLEQAIVDAAALREAALKNAEQSIIEKYAPQIKEAVEAMLENDESVSASKKMKYEGRIVDVIHEVDNDGNVTVSEAGGKPFLVKETDLSEASDDDVLQEQEMDAAADTATTPPEIEAPPSWDSRYGDSEQVTLSALLNNVDADGDIEIDLDSIELSLAQQEEAAIDTPTEEPGSDLLASPEEPAEETPGGEPEGGLDDLLGDLGDLGGDDTDLQEILNILSEYDEDLLEEEIHVDMEATKDGTFQTHEETLQYEVDKEMAKKAHQDEEEEDEESKKDDEKLQEALKDFDQLQQAFLILKGQNDKLESVVYKLNDKLEETLLSNARLLYQNRTLCDASLNERQKSKIVEAIGNAESPKEAKSLHETLKATVGSESKKGPQSLSESVNRKSNLSSMLNRRQNLNESQTSDPFFDKMKKLAGINNNN